MLSYRIAQMLLEVGAVSLRPLDPFRFASGLLSPIYCDNRLLISYPRERRLITEGFVQILRELDLVVGAIAGTATAGIPHAAWLAAALDLPMVYVRSQSKDHGQARLVEGVLPIGQEVVVVEDLVTTGASALRTVNAIRQQGDPSAGAAKSAVGGARVEHILAIFSYGFPQAEQAFAEAGVRLDSLTTLVALLEVAVDENSISPQERALVQSWAEDPAGWSQARKVAALQGGAERS
ncbi:MAG: orotate phosphoribosyltransferase [Chloroflexia bacterium]|nr:orotate phosphoribosyltransferase [Chloroflexia bacterium]